MLKCYSSDAGNPPSSVTWSYDGNVTLAGELFIHPLTAEHDKQLVKCQLQNNFTSLTGKPIESVAKQLSVECKYICYVYLYLKLT